MGSNELIVIALFAAPVLVLLLLRINATMVFLSLCLGYVLIQFLSADIQSFAGTFFPQMGSSSSLMGLGLLLAPAVLTAIFRIHSVKGSKALLNVLPALAVGGLTVLLVVPSLSPGLHQAILALPLWHQIAKLQSLTIGAGALISLFFMWAQRSHHNVEKKGGKHH